MLQYQLTFEHPENPDDMFVSYTQKSIVFRAKNDVEAKRKARKIIKEHQGYMPSQPVKEVTFFRVAHAIPLAG